jgi:Flp pilus assembly protein TadG
MDSLRDAPTTYKPGTSSFICGSKRKAFLMRLRKGETVKLKRLRGSRGAQLLEFALAMPMLIVVAIGITDFGAAYNQKHIITNAAREAARITVSNSLSDASCPDATPCSIEAAADSVKQYLTNAGMNTASCMNAKSPSSSGTQTWTWACNNVSLTINRVNDIGGGPSGSKIATTQVTLSYPYTFIYGKVIKLLVPGGTGLNGLQTLTTTVVMQNLA